MTDTQKIKDELMSEIAAPPNSAYSERFMYYEFNPKDYNGISHLIESIQKMCMEKFDCVMNEYEFQIGRVENNAELHFIKCELYKPPSHV